MSIIALGRTLSSRRQELGLTQERLAKMTNVSRRTIQALESGMLKDIGYDRLSRLLDVLGLSLTPDLAPRKRRRGLWMAAKNASVSYRGELSPEMLEQTLATAQAPTGFGAHVGHFLDESPVDYVVMAVEEAAKQEHRKPAEIWANVRQLALRHSIKRKDMWA